MFVQTLSIGRLMMLLLAVACLSSVGCASADWSVLRGEGLSDTNNWSKGIRNNSAGRPTGVSQMAQDIEKNLGYY